jgi:hypothetical protein
MAFIFNAQAGETPETIARKREIAEALAGSAMGRAPKDVGEGLHAVGQALAFRRMMSQIGKSEAAGRESASGAFGPIMAALGGGGAPSTPAASSQASAPMDPASARVAQAHSASGGAGDIRGGIEQTAQSLGIDPIDLATAISYETAGTFDPTKAGPTTQWGQHKGLIQFGEPQAKQYGVDWSNPIGSQLGPDGAVAKYLRDTGVKPGMGLMDIYSAINAGGVGRNDRSDANNGGAPGTVADKVNNQMAGHRAKALAMFSGGQVADASGALENMAQAGAPQMTPDMVAQSYAQTQGMPQPAPQQAPQQAPVNPQIAQALGQNNPGNIGMSDGQGGIVQAQGDFPPPPQAQGAGPTVQQLLQAAQNPWLNDSQKSIINMLLEKQMTPKQYDFITGRDGSIFRADPTEGKIDQVYGGKPDLPTDVQEYEYARNQGYGGTFAEFQVEQKKAGASQVNIDQKAEGAFDKKLAEKDAETYSTMSTEGMNAKADLGIIGELDALLQGQGGTLTGLKGWAASKGLDVGEATDDLQAANALIKKLVPTQRQPGSGSMSDRDVELFTQSLPSLWNQPGGNQKILGVMKGLAQYKQEQGRISDAVLTGEMTRQEARKQLQALPNPLAEFQGNKSDKPDGAAAKPTTDEEYNALPSGSLFIDPDDGKTYRKP